MKYFSLHLVIIFNPYKAMLPLDILKKVAINPDWVKSLLLCYAATSSTTGSGALA